METLSLAEALHSKSNRLFLQLRTALKFRRSGYRESGGHVCQLSGEAARAELRYGMLDLRPRLLETTYRKNISTLVWLEQLNPYLGEIPRAPQIIETGAQDFSRWPALRRYFELHGKSPSLTGVELDPYPVLTDLHSRADKADYYLSLLPGHHDQFLAGDFFGWNSSADLILSFYPFVSPHPALAWGLPAEFGDASAWTGAFLRNLRPGGFLLVVHQGEWEEREFDSARSTLPLELLSRGKADDKIYPLPHPPHLSIYRRKK